MFNRLFIFILCLFFAYAFTGCSGKSVEEPEGIPVSLTDEEINPEIQALEKSSKKWYAWHTKGLELAQEQNLEEALYCFNQAIKAWPEEPPEDRPKALANVRYFPEPTDTLLQKGLLFIEMRQPDLALLYLDKFDSYLGSNRSSLEFKAVAYYMLGEYEQAFETCETNKTNYRCKMIKGAIDYKQSNGDKGADVIMREWRRLEQKAENSESFYNSLYNTHWPLLPEDIQTIINDNIEE